MQPIEARDDGSVIEALRRGDEGAFARLVAEYHASPNRVVLCAYAVRALSGRQLLLSGVESHPLTIRRGALRHNQHFVAAD